MSGEMQLEWFRRADRPKANLEPYYKITCTTSSHHKWYKAFCNKVPNKVTINVASVSGYKKKMKGICVT